LCLQVDGEREKNFHRRGAEREEDAEGEEQKGDLTQGQKSSSILITSHESQITVEQSETQHKGAKAQRSEGKEMHDVLIKKDNNQIPDFSVSYPYSYPYSYPEE